MMMDSFHTCLSVLDAVRDSLEQLTELTRHKIKAVEADDLLGLNEILNQEQALALTFRGLEQKRKKALEEIHMADVPLARLAAGFPPALQDQAGQALQALQAQYRAYQSCAGLARKLLEDNLREIERTLSQMGVAEPAEGPGYAEAREAAPPPSMKTDFRA